jgi:hypothetical protein
MYCLSGGFGVLPFCQPCLSFLKRGVPAPERFQTDFITPERAGARRVTAAPLAYRAPCFRLMSFVMKSLAAEPKPAPFDLNFPPANQPADVILAL